MRELDKIIKIFKVNLKDNLKCLILGGSRGKNNQIDNWSDYDIYVITSNFDSNKLNIINEELSKNISCHVGITQYTTYELENRLVDDKTKVMFYEKNSFDCNPIIFGNIDKFDITLDEIKKDDLVILPQVIHDLKRTINTDNYKKLIKRTTVLLKIILRKDNNFAYGYKNVFDQFYKYLDKKKIEFHNKIDIINCIQNENCQIVNFVKEIITNYNNL